MPNLTDCAAYPRALCRHHAQSYFVSRNLRRIPVALWRMEAVAARRGQSENVAHGRSSASDFRQYRDLGGAG